MIMISLISFIIAAILEILSVIIYIEMIMSSDSYGSPDEALEGFLAVLSLICYPILSFAIISKIFPRKEIKD